MGLRVYVLITVAALGLAASLAYLTWPTTFATPFFSVSYQNNLVQRITLRVANWSGYPTYFCASIYGWLPNESFMFIDVKCGLGSVELNETALRKYAGYWRGAAGQIGVFVFLTYVNGTKGGSYTLGRAVKGFLIDPKRVLAGQSLTATIYVRGKPPNLPVDFHFGPTSTAAAPASTQFQSWPPPTIDTGYYVWFLNTVYAEAADTPVPVIVVRVADPFSASMICCVAMYFEVSTSQSTEIYFNGGAEVVYNGITQGFESDIYSFSIYQNVQAVSAAATYYPSTQGPGVAAVGFYGDYAIANYTEYEVYPDGRISPTGYSAILYVIRPTGGGVIVGYSEVDAGASFSNSRLNNLMSQVSAYWTPEYVYGTGPALAVDSWSLVQDQEGIPIFSLAIPIIETRLLEQNLNLATGLGANINGVYIGYTTASFVYGVSSQYFLVGKYYIPATKYEYNGVYYPIPSMFIDVYVGEGTT
ncbi:MAG: hypothetical protein ACP5MH_05130 [Thermoproteus sp.]